MAGSEVNVTLFRWAGAWGPFKVKIPCSECALTKDVIRDTLATELAGIPVNLDIREWLTEWWKPLLKGGWHAPIVMVDGKVISQGVALNRGILTEAVITAHAKKTPVIGSHLFGKDGCPHCQRAKAYLQEAGIRYTYHDVVRSPRDLYEMLARVLPMMPPKTPITVPQIWLGGRYIGGADQLEAFLQQHSVTEKPVQQATRML
ncbi:MAG: glutaredoxin [Cyanobacteria bacterium J06559_3]